MRLAVPLVLLLAACASSAPHTIPAAAVHGALAAGASLASRSEGGCYVPCTHGTVCNPATGYCERPVCGSGTGAAMAACGDVPPLLSERERGLALPVPGTLGPNLGLSPASGTAPTLPPEKASVESPARP